MPLLEDVFAELNAIQTWNARSQRANSAAAAIPQRQVEQMQLAAQMWPDLSPGALLALGKGGYSADHPMAQQLAELSAKLRMQDHPYGAEYGQQAISPAMHADYAKAQAQLSLRKPMPVGVADNPEALKLWKMAENAGLVDKSGFLHDPFKSGDASDDPTNYLFEQVSEGIAGLVGEIYYMEDHSGRPVVLRPEEGDYRKRYVSKPPEEQPGLGLLDQARVLTGKGPESPGQMAMAGAVDAAITAPIRGAFMTMDAPVQELQGQVRNLYALAHGDVPDFWETQSDFGITLTSGIEDAGTGFFVDQESAVAAERRRREAERGQIGGHNVTLGRWMVDGLTPFDPDTKPAMILSGAMDAAVQAADPTAFGLGKAGEASRAARLFVAAGDEEAAGVVRGLRWMTRPTDAAKFLDSPKGIEALATYAATSSPTDIWRMSGRKFPMELATRLADEAATPDEVRAILEPQLGRSVREVAAVGTERAGPITRMPARGRIDAHDQDLVAFEVEATLRNARAQDPVIRKAVDRVARADSPIKLNAAITDALDDVGGILEASGVADEALRRRLTRLHADTHQEMSDTFSMAFAHQGQTDNPLMVGGEQQWYPGAHLIAEHAPRYITLPDPREIRRYTSRFSNVFTNPAVRVPTIVLEALQNEAWKPLQLMRMAWTARVIGEEQIRMAAAGYDSMFRHPLSFIGWRTGRKGATDVIGEQLDESLELKNSLSQIHGGWVDRAIVPTGVKTTYVKGRVDERVRFNEAWGSELVRLNSDPVAKYVANAESLDDAVDWFTRGAGNKFRSDLAAAHPGRFDTLDQARAYIETVQKRTDYATGGNANLLEAVRTGWLDGEQMLTGTTLNSKIPGRLDTYHDAVAPERIMGEESRTLRQNNMGKAIQYWDTTVDRLFGFLMTNRTNNLSRSPTFKQEYWREAERLIPFASENTRAAVIAQAKEAGLGSRAIRRMERATARGELSLDELDLLAKGQGLDETKRLLYDLTQRGRFMDAARLVFPFGEAWTEVLTRWFDPKNGLIRNNPKVIRRFQQLMQGARGEDFGEVIGSPEGEGFFWRNEFGEEVFTYPGSTLLTDKLLGVPIPLTGRVQGLSMFGSIIPGLGPAAQIPVGWILEQKPGPQLFKDLLNLAETKELGPLGTVKENINPFGSIGAEDQAEVFSIPNYFPSWMRSAVDFVTAGDGHEQQYANTVMSVASYLRSTGRYGNSIADQQQLMEDAAHEARWFTLIKAIGQSVAPAAPSPDWLLEANGEQVRARALAEEYTAMKKEDFAHADQNFMDIYGADVLAAVQPKTVGVEYSIPTTRAGVKWVMDNPGVKGDLPHTYGFFAPTDGEFDYALYDKQLRSGDREQLAPDEYVRLMNDTKGDLRYQAALAQVGEERNTDNGRAYLAEVREWIYKNYPGWGDSSGLPQRPETDVLIREFYDAADNEAVRKTDAGKGLALYLEARDQVLADALERGYAGFADADEMEDGRIYLNEVAAWVTRKHPGFAPIFDVVFSRETEVDADG